MVKRMGMLVAMALVVGLIAGTASAAEKRGGGLNIKTREVSGVVNINTATTHELELLPGIGPKTAKQIVAFREKQPFKAPADLVKVKGIGDGLFKRIKAYLSISGPTTLTVVKAGSSGHPAAAAEKPAAGPVAAK